MKLRNKKTGEIGKILKQLSEDNQIEVITDSKLYVVKTLAELNEEWEDYEEPAYYYFIQDDGRIGCDAVEPYNHKSKVEEHKSIGNYFSSKEEAELAVCKLKAWKRLKDDYHIRFDLDFVKNTISFTYRIDGTLHSAMDDEPIVFEDMKTIFGGEE